MIILQDKFNGLIQDLNLPQMYLSGHSNSQLRIITECGKTLVDFYGTRIPNKLTNKERDALIDSYLDPILYRCGHEIAELYNLLLDNTTRDALSNYKEKVTKKYPGITIQGKSAKYSCDEFYVNYSNENGATFETRSYKYLPLGLLTTIKVKAKQLERVFKSAAPLQKAFNEHNDSIIKLKAEINPPCSI